MSKVSYKMVRAANIPVLFKILSEYAELDTSACSRANRGMVKVLVFKDGSTVRTGSTRNALRILRDSYNVPVVSEKCRFIGTQSILFFDVVDPEPVSDRRVESEPQVEESSEHNPTIEDYRKMYDPDNKKESKDRLAEAAFKDFGIELQKNKTFDDMLAVVFEESE
jgi:hypothetical protein